MTHSSPRPVVKAFLDAIAHFGAVGSGIEGGPAMVTAGWVCGFGQPKPSSDSLVSCDLENTPSTHGVLALAAARGVAHGAAQDLRAWISAYAPILDRNGARFHLSSGVFVNDGALTQIVQIELGPTGLSQRGSQEVVAGHLCDALERFARLNDGGRSFRNLEHFEVSQTLLAGEPASAIAYACMMRPKQADAYRATQWCEIFPARAHDGAIAQLLEPPHDTPV